MPQHHAFPSQYHFLHHQVHLKQPHRRRTPVIEWMESRCSCDLKFESYFRIHRNLPAHTIFSLLLMGLFKYPKTPCRIGELAVAWWFRSGCQGIIQHMVDDLSDFCLLKTGVQIVVGESRIVGVQQVDLFEIGPMYHLVDDILEGVCHSGHCNHHDRSKGWYKCWMPMRWCRLDLHQVAWHRIQSMERIRLPFFTDNAGKAVVRHNHPLFKGIPP